MGELGIGYGALESYHERMMGEDWVNLGPRAGFLHTALVGVALCCCSVAKLCPTFCDPMDCSRPGSSDRKSVV